MFCGSTNWPCVVVKVTLPEGTGFPLASVTVATMAERLLPSAGMEEGVAEMEILAAGPATKVTVVAPETLVAVAVAVTVTVPA